MMLFKGDIMTVSPLRKVCLRQFLEGDVVWSFLHGSCLEASSLGLSYENHSFMEVVFAAVVLGRC